MDILKREYKEILIDQLKEGMATYEDIYNKFGNVVIPAKTKIMDLNKIANLLKHHNVLSIKVVITEEDADCHGMDLETMENSGDFSELEERLKEIKNKEEIATFRNDFKVNQAKVQKGFEDILKGQQVTKDQIKENIDRTLESFKGSINVFQLLEKMKDLDDITYAHSQNVTVISHSIGKWLGLKEEQLQSLVLSAMLVDIGKMKVPNNILNKKAHLTQDELEECKKHVIYSFEMIKNYDFIKEDVKQAVLLHHEKIDGTGYPLGVKEEKIPLLARIIAIADIYNALTSERPYRSKKSPFEAIKIMETEYRDKLDLKIMYIFLNRIGNCFLGQRVKLQDSRVGEIVYVSKQNIYRPVIKLQETGELIDLNIRANSLLNIVDFV